MSGLKVADLPERFLCPMCEAHLHNYQEHLERRAKWELEDKLRDGTASMPERVKAAWAQFKGKPWDWERGGPQLNIPEPIYQIPDYRLEGPVCDTLQVFRFEREITRAKGYEVHRIHCNGITVQETYKETRQ